MLSRKVGALVPGTTRDTTNSETSTLIVGPPEPPKVNERVASVFLILHGTMTPQSGSETAPTPTIMAWARSSSEEKLARDSEERDKEKRIEEPYLGGRNLSCRCQV